DRAVKSVEQFGMKGPVERWRAVRDQIHASVCREGFDAEQGSFVQAYGSKELDASLLLVPVVGFLPPSDSRVRGTVAAMTKRLVGNFPQAFSHVSLVNTALNLSRAEGPAHDRQKQ